MPVLYDIYRRAQVAAPPAARPDFSSPCRYARMPAVANVVFMGTPEFAVPSLRALVETQTVAGVVTQPDRPAGRGQQAVASPVKRFALEASLPVIQPHTLRGREPEAMNQLKVWAPDVIVVCAFGQILKPAVLDLPPHGCLNVHASLLPRHRGAAPIPAAILAGDHEAGVTLMRIDAGLDTGPLLAQRAEPIRPDDTTLSLSERLARLGAALLAEVLPDYLAGKLTAEPQDNALVTYAPQLKKADGHLDFSQPAVELERRVRAFNPWPGAFALWQDQPLRILRASVTASVGGEPGLVTKTDRGPAIACGSGGLLLLEVQPAGKKPMPAADFARGTRDFIGARLN